VTTGGQLASDAKSRSGMFKFTASTEGQNRLGMRELWQTFADGFGVPAHMLSHDAADMIKRQAHVELELLTLEGERMDL